MNARLAALALSTLLAGGAAAQDAPAPEAAAGPDTSGWACRFCAFEDGWTGWLEPRVGGISDDSYRFGDFTGLHEQGTVVDLAGAWRWREAATGRSLDVHTERLGLESRALGVSGGRQGRYRAWLEYEGIPHYVAADGASPFRGGSALTLPAGWVTAGSTAGMTELDAGLRAARLQQTRERGILGAAFVPHPLADARIEYRRDEIRGTALTGASFLTLASQLPRPVDQVLDRIDSSVALRHAVAHAQLALESSFYSGGPRALAWQNPYNAPAPGATAGQLAQAPDNSAHRLTLTAGTAPARPLQLAGQLTLGRLLQDERFLPATVNPDEAVAPPRPSLDARVDTTLAALRGSYTFGRALRLNADVLRDDRDARTPVDDYTQVVMDTFTGDVRANAPFGFTRNRWRFSAERRSAPRVAVGVDDDRRERRLHGTGETTERRYWGRIGVRPFAGADLKLRLAHARRTGTEYAPAAGVPAQNPLARAYNTAERDRDEARADFSFGEGALASSVHATWARDEYPDTTLGRTEGDELGYGADLALRVGEALSLSAFAAHREQQAGQAGSQAFGAPDWLADQEDATNVLGASLSWQARGDLDVGADYTFTTSEGSITMLAAAVERDFPLLVTRWHDARLFARYAVRPDLALRFDLLYERYAARDWGQQGLDAATVGNLLALGQGTQDGDVLALLLGARYEFGGPPKAD
jgi:MtrB/PioB family decaheme-associated outer membrane protein